MLRPLLLVAEGVEGGSEGCGWVVVMGGARVGEVVRLVVEVTDVVGCWLVDLLGGVFSRESEGWSMVAMGGICGAEERAGGGLWSALFLLLLRKERRRMKRGL